jgi:hypothetical protein
MKSDRTPLWQHLQDEMKANSNFQVFTDVGTHLIIQFRVKVAIEEGNEVIIAAMWMTGRQLERFVSFGYVRRFIDHDV